MLNYRTLLKLARPVQLLFAALTFTLGAGIARYLGHSVGVVAFALGLLAVWSLQAASGWLVEYFRLPLTPLAQGETPRQRERSRVALLQASYAALTLAGAVIVSLLATGLLNLPAGILFALVIICLVAYALPPLRLSEMGYGELLLAVVLGFLLPALAFLLQFDDFHRLLTFAAFPLTLLALACFLAGDFPTFATDLKLGHHTLLTRLGWQRAIPVHHFLVVAAFLLFAIAPRLWGIPWGLVWPVFLILPFAFIQVIWLQRIAQGGRTLWKFFTGLAAATFGLVAYLLALTFWIR